MRRDISRAKASLLVIFGAGAVAVALAVAWVTRNLPAGDLPSGYVEAPARPPATGARTVAPCRKLGDRCELSPGKLGVCMVRDDCSGRGCLFCQSQH